MSMPTNLFLVRHGRSEGNSMRSRYKKTGASDTFTEEFLDRHESEYRLTEAGVEQAKRAGTWIRSNIDLAFDRKYVSPHIRACETAGHLALDGHWYVDPRLRERDGGLFNTIPPDVRDTEYADMIRHAKAQPYLWRPPQGESIADVGMRTKNVLETLARECDSKNVIVVCHGHVIRTFRIWLERETFACNEICRDDGEVAVKNCCIWQYTRIDPSNPTAPMAPHLNWRRVIDPTTDEPIVGEWTAVQRPTYTSQELLEHVEKTVRLNR